MAVLHQRQGAAGGVLCRCEGADHELQSGRHRLRPAQQWSLRQEHRRHRLGFLEVFRSPYFVDVSLSDWLTHTPPAMVAATFNMDPATIAKFPKDKPEVLARFTG